VTWVSARLRNGRAPGPTIGRPWTARHRLTVDASGDLEMLAMWLRVHGCLNPHQRARELAHTGVCRFYRPEDDSVVIVEADAIRMEQAS
jgi:hypothetical protein